MTIKTALGNLRTSLKIKQEIEHAQATEQIKSVTKRSPLFAMPFAAAFCFMLCALAGPASAAIDLNSTIGPILDGVSNLVPSIVNLIVSIVPAIIVLAVVGFIVTFLDKILNMLHL